MVHNFQNFYVFIINIKFHINGYIFSQDIMCVMTLGIQKKDIFNFNNKYILKNSALDDVAYCTRR